MSEPSGPAPVPLPGAPENSPGNSDEAKAGSKYIDAFLYVSAFCTYIPLAIYNKWLLDWIVGPFWLVAWVWGLPSLWKLIRRQPVKPRRGPSRDPK